MARQLLIFVLFMIAGLIPFSASAQDTQNKEIFTVRFQSVFYGDNTEFVDNPFSDGETIFGAYNRLYADVPLAPKARLKIGIFANRRFGSNKFEKIRPVISLVLGSPDNQFIFGTLHTYLPNEVAAYEGLSSHGLVPALQVEILAIDRIHESGVQWLKRGGRFLTNSWLNWQQLNTPVQREKFDVGIVDRLKLGDSLSLGFQGHIVHYGGQLYSVGAVSDSVALGPGLILEDNIIGKAKAYVELYWLFSKYTPDREVESETRTGSGAFLRTIVEKDSYKAHAIIWRSEHYIKNEGDPNYQDLRMNGSYFNSIRDYAEIGLAKKVYSSKAVSFEVSGRVFWIEHDLDYAYRLMGVVDLTRKFTRKTIN